MPLCPPETPPDECNQCLGYPLWWDFVGMSNTQLPPEVRDDKCEVGCRPCPHEELTLTSVSRCGSRWMRATVSGGPNRMANGMIGDLLSVRQTSWPYRRFIHEIQYDRAPCYLQYSSLITPAGECFDDDACDCDPSIEPDTHLAGDPPTCNNGAQGPGEVVPGRFADRFFYAGFNWPADMWCRRVENHIGATWQAQPRGTLYMPEIWRMEDAERNQLKEVACNSNVFIPCVARRVGSSCDTVENPPEFYTDIATRDAFRYVTIESNSTHFTTPAQATEREQADIEAKTQVLYRIARQQPFEDTTFDRLNYLGVAGAGNQPVVWNREYHQTGGLPDDEKPEVEHVFGECRTMYGRELVTPRLTVDFVTFTMHLIGHFVQNGGPHEQQDWTKTELWPHARVSIIARCSVSSNATELIDYKDPQGRRLTPPTYVKWLGYLGHSIAATRTRNVWGDEPRPQGQNNHVKCCHVLNVLDRLQVGGWPYYTGSFQAASGYPSDGVYGGVLIFGFKLHNFDTDQICSDYN